MENIKSYQNPELPVDERVEDLLKRMGLKEKIAQLKASGMYNLSAKTFSDLLDGIPQVKRRELEGLFMQSLNQKTSIMQVAATNYWKKYWKESFTDNEDCELGQFSAALRHFSPGDSAAFSNEIQKFALEQTHLGIPLIIHDECLHGCAGNGCTIFPQAIALASSWDPELMSEVSTVIGKETKARGVNQGLAPTMNIARDPRCGRTEETYGEDPYLTTAMAVSFVRGVQDQKVIATPKHFAANFVGDGGRDSTSIDISERTLREIYFPAFKACIEEANALSVMAAYNSIEGSPCHCNRRLLTDILRGEWGFEGFVVSDYHAVLRLKVLHNIADTNAEAAKRALEAGMDIELPASVCYDELFGLVEKGELSEEVINISVRRFLKAKYWLGLFDDPYVDPEYAEMICDCEEHRMLALKTARKSIVLLKNDGILPFTRKVSSIAVIGPNADEARLGGYGSYGVDVVTPLEGIRKKAGDTIDVYFAEGCRLTGNSKEGFEEAVSVVKKSDIAVLFLGNSSPETEGEQRDRCSLDLPGVQEELIKEISDTGTPVIVVLINGSAVTMEKWIYKARAIVEAWYPGEEGGTAISDVLFGDYNPGGKLPITFPKTVGQLPLYYNPKPTGRVESYVDLREDQALFPFGHGLSYTEFEYSNLQINPKVTDPEQNINISVEVKNTGKYTGDEVVQLYIHDVTASVARPVKELKGFRRIALDPGKKETVSFTVTPEDLSFYDIDMNFITEPGSFEVMVGSSSEDIRIEGSFEIT